MPGQRPHARASPPSRGLASPAPAHAAGHGPAARWSQIGQNDSNALTFWKRQTTCSGDLSRRWARRPHGERPRPPHSPVAPCRPLTLRPAVPGPHPGPSQGRGRVHRLVAGHLVTYQALGPCM